MIPRGGLQGEEPLIPVDDANRGAEIGPGALLGERALLEGGKRTATVWAKTPIRVAVVPAHLGVPPAFAVRDELSGEQYDWRLGRNYVRLDPWGRQVHVFRVLQ